MYVCRQTTLMVDHVANKFSGRVGYRVRLIPELIQAKCRLSPLLHRDPSLEQIFPPQLQFPPTKSPAHIYTPLYILTSCPRLLLSYPPTVLPSPTYTPFIHQTSCPHLSTVLPTSTVPTILPTPTLPHI